jgi:hypothetical protein
MDRQHFRYPEARSDYARNIALISEFTYNIIFQDLGYNFSFTHHPNANGVDLKPENDTGVEIWNFCEPHSYESKIESVKKNLSKYKHRYLITSFISEPLKAEFEQQGITTIVTGFQILVNDEKYQSFYGDTECKEYFSAEVVIALKQLIIPYFPPVAVHPPVRCVANKEPDISGYVYTSNLTNDTVLNCCLKQRILRIIPILKHNSKTKLQDFIKKLSSKSEPPASTSAGASAKAKISEKVDADCTAVNETQSVRLEFGETMQYCLLTEDNEYLFYGREIKRDYVIYLWSTLTSEQMPQVTAIVVNPETVTQMAGSDEVTGYSTPLLPKMDSYLIIVTNKDYKQFVESLRLELFRICMDGYTKSLEGDELVKFQLIVEQQAKSYGAFPPRLLLDNSLYF